jgi:hypothetical protein
MVGALARQSINNQSFCRGFLFSIAFVGMALCRPVASEAKIYTWADIADPTFSGTVFFLECRQTSMTMIGVDQMPEPLSELSVNTIRVSIKERTIEFNNGGKHVPVEIRASILGGAFTKRLRITSKGLRLHIELNGEVDGSLSGSYAVSMEGMVKGVTNIGFGTCQPTYGAAN